MKKRIFGHVLALSITIIWGVTYIATDLLLGVYSPLQILLFRFLLAYGVLWIAHPRMQPLAWRTEGRFFLLGFTGGTLCFWAENAALTFTSGTTVSVIVATAPILTALLAVCTGRIRLGFRGWIGTVVAFSGVLLVIFGGTDGWHAGILGELLALLASLSWAVYSIAQEKATKRFSSLFIVRKIMFYGALTCFPLVICEQLFTHNPPPLSLVPLSEIKLLVPLLFLGLLGSAVGYIFWAQAQVYLGTLTLSHYLYAIPFVTMTVSRVALGEPITPYIIIGALLTTFGVFFAADKTKSLDPPSATRWRP